MKKTLTILAVLVTVPAGAAWADDDCFVSMTDWQPLDNVAELAAQNGWAVQQIEVDDGCYEIDARDAEGRRIELTIHPATLQVIELDYKDDDDDDGDRRDRGRGGDD